MKVKGFLDGVRSILNVLSVFSVTLGLIIVLASVGSDVTLSSGLVVIAFLLGLVGGISGGLSVILGGVSENLEDEDNGKVSEQKAKDNPTKTV